MSLRQNVRSAPRRKGGPARLWILPPALLRGVGETLEGAAVLNEFSGEVGLKLWQVARDVRLWAEVGPEHRQGLFRGTTAALAEPLEERGDSALLAPLALLRLEMAHPSRAIAGTVASECLRISRYAEASRRPGTAALFAIVASLAEPQRATPAYEAGRLSLAGKDEVRAETWFRRALGLARRGYEWRTYCRSLVRIADIYALRSDGARAAKLYTIAMRASRRHAMREPRGEAALGLLRLALAAGDREAAERLEGVARRAFGRDNAHIPELVCLVVRLRIESGERTLAATALRRLIPDLESDEDRMAAYALLSRANAESLSSIAEPWHQAWALTEARPDSGERDRALVDLALSAIEVGSAERARAAYQRVPSRNSDPPSALQRDYDLVRSWLASSDLDQRDHR